MTGRSPWLRDGTLDEDETNERRNLMSIIVTPEAKEQIENAKKHMDLLINHRLDQIGGDKDKLRQQLPISTSIGFNPPGEIARNELRKYYREKWGFTDILFEDTSEGCKVTLK